MLKPVGAASAARTDMTAKMLMERIDQIGNMVSQLVQQQYNPATVELNAVDKATEEAIAASLQKRPVLPATSPITPAPPAEKSVVSQASSATGSHNANASHTSQDAALLLEQQTAMSDSNSHTRSAEDPPKDVTLSPPRPS